MVELGVGGDLRRIALKYMAFYTGYVLALTSPSLNQSTIVAAAGSGLTGDKKLFIYSGNGYKKLAEYTILNSAGCNVLTLASKNLDADIYDEIIVGCQNYSSNTGKVFLIDVQ
jgi:hypothetical protein